MSVLNENTIIGASAAGGDYEIEQSLRFNDVSAAYLSRTLAVSGSRTTMTMSMWAKRGNLGLDTMWLFGTSGNWEGARFWSDDTLYISGPNSSQWITNAKFRDTSAWYHFVFVFDTTNSTESDRLRFYVNGERQTFSSEGALALNQTTTSWNVSGATNTIANQGTSNRHFDGYLAEVNFIDGLALTPDSFGETGDYGEWKPIAYAGTYGTNGFYLKFENASSLGNDSAGSNNWTPNNLAATDQMVDSPTNNFATINPIGGINSGLIFSEGNLQLTSSSGNWRSMTTTFSRNSGKWYLEVVKKTIGNGSFFGITTATNNNLFVDNNYVGKFVNDFGFRFSDYGTTTDAEGYATNASFTSLGSAQLVVGDILQIAVDYDNNKIWFGRNGTYYSSGNPATGANGIAIAANTDYFVGVTTQINDVNVLNFGQDSSFAGNKTPQGNQDSNDIGDFYYAPPTGFLALCTANLPSVDVIPSEHFNTVLYTGNATARSIAGLDFQPDLTWIKARSATYQHTLVDSIRGTGNWLESNATAAEQTGGAPDAFNSDGFDLTTWGQVNGSGQTYAAWNWKAGGAGVSNTNGTITSSVSANPSAGFSIVSYTGTGANGATVGHGLSVAPELIINKKRNASQSWYVWHEALASTSHGLSLDTTAAQGAFSYGTWGTKTSTIMTASQGANGLTNVNATGDTYISYAFHSVDGYSKVGSYTGNSSTDGTFVHCGFRPAYVMIKRTANTGHWFIWDEARNQYNVMDKTLKANDSSAEGTDPAYYLDFTSNGFKLRTTFSAVNYTGENYIYLAFAETPFKNSNAR